MSKAETLTRDIRASLARLTDTHPDDWFLTFRARDGMEAVFSAVKATHGSGEIITQPLTCATAVNPILSAGHIPVYTDTSYDDLSLDTAKLEASRSSRALIMQHSFGLESALQKGRTFTQKHRLLLVEDSAHQLGQMAKKDGVPLADVSVHSFGVEKLLPTKFGGAIWINPAMQDTTLQKALRSTLAALPVISRKQSGLAHRYRFFNRTLNATPRFAEPAVRSFLIKIGAFQPAIMPDELMGKNHAAPARPDAFVLGVMLDGLKQYRPVVTKRLHATNVYRERLSDHFALPKKLPDDYAPVRFPLLCHNAAQATRLYDALRAGGHYSGKWYRPTLFPGVLDTKQYNYDPELCPVAEDISARILNLPTNITAHEAKEIADDLQREIGR